jgi:SAM-dependent methyltransferase
VRSTGGTTDIKRGVREDAAAQERYARASESYFWNTAHNDVALRTLAPHLRRLRARAGRPLRLLDLGCGVGNTLRVLDGTDVAFGVEYSTVALAVARRRGVDRVVAGDGLWLPVASQALDAVLALEVVEHFADDAGVLRETFRILRPGGVLVASVPAFMALWRSHDELYGHHRRYSRVGFRRLLAAAGFAVQRCEFIKCAYFLPLLVRARLDRARRGATPGGDDFFQLPGWVNEVLRRQIVWEHRLRLNRLLPFGVSLLAVATRPADPPPAFPRP